MPNDRQDGVRAALGIKAPVIVASTGALTASGLQTIDGIALSEGDRILRKDEVATADNGIYVAAEGAWSRAVDFDGNTDFTCGTLIPVALGTLNAGRLYRVTSTAVGVDVSPITFSRIVTT